MALTVLTQQKIMKKEYAFSAVPSSKPSSQNDKKSETNIQRTSAFTAVSKPNFSMPEKRLLHSDTQGSKIAKTSAFTAVHTQNKVSSPSAHSMHEVAPMSISVSSSLPEIDELSYNEVSADKRGAVYLALEKHTLTSIKASDGQEAIFFGRLDMSKVPNRGNCKYAAQRFTGDDLHRLQELASKATPHEKTVLSDTRRFVDFLEANPGVESMGAALAQFAAQAAGHLGPASAKNLAKNVKGALLAARVETGSLALCDAVLDGLDLTYAEAGAQHAVDITEVECKSWLPFDPPYRIKKVQARAMIWIMCTCGARNADILRAAMSIQLDLAHSRLSATFAVTKTNRTVSDKRTVSFPFFCKPDLDILSFMNSKGWEEQLPDADALNAVLKKADLKKVVQVQGKDPRSITSYSFRRLFIHRVISWYTDDEGIVDWMKVIQWSGHKTDDIVCSTYSVGQVLTFPTGQKDAAPLSKKQSLLSQLTTEGLGTTDTHLH